MRIVLDTEKGRIILPKSFFTHLDKMNKCLYFCILSNL